MGGTVGFMDATDLFLNAGQISADTADPRPNPTATLSPSATVAGGFLGFNQQVLYPLECAGVPRC